MPFIPKQVYIDAEIEERPGPISVYRTANGGTSSRELRQGLLRRWERWREVFSIDGEATDLGDRIAFLGESTALEVYLASESVWWTDRTKAYREDPGEGGVPDDDQAVHLARRFIETTFAPAVDLTDVVVGEQVASVSTSPDAEPRSQRVAVAVTLRPVVSGRPVFGPGAKVRVSFADGAEPSDVAYFSRSLEPDGEAETLHPYQALERLRRDRRFTDVIAAGMELHVRRFQHLLHDDGWCRNVRREVLGRSELLGKSRYRDARQQQRKSRDPHFHMWDASLGRCVTES